MNRVTVDNKEKRLNTTLGKLIGADCGETAFIGRCGDGPDNTLYLVCYDTIVAAGEPQCTWVNKDCPVQVRCFVDVDMTVRAKR